jgi:ribosomal protein S18 acetylase RimI-like enzyme
LLGAIGNYNGRVNGRSSVKKLSVQDAASLTSLRREALAADPLAFAASVDDDFALDAGFVERALANDREQAVFGYFDAGHLRGMVGVVRASKLKQRHTATVWGMYVSGAARRRGAGRALIEAAIAQAREWGIEQMQLSVSETASEAKRLYEAAGFTSWGRQPRALQWQGRFVDEDHMVLELREPGG